MAMRRGGQNWNSRSPLNRATMKSKKYTFKPRLVATVCLLVLFPLFIALGVWQLHRADEKRAIMALRERNGAEPPVLLMGKAEAADADRYRQVQAFGEYDVDHQFLLDNQIFNQQAGYWVMTPLRLADSDAAVLVNRGWVPVGSDRSRLPQLGVSSPYVRITGLIDHFPGVGYKLKGAEIPGSGWPSVVQMLDAGQLSARLGYRLLPYQVLLAPDQPQGYARSWRPPDLNPGKNQGYALQWFSFAAVLVILYIGYGIKSRSDPERPSTGN
jgi:surfeit locus 1 family protein